MLSIFFKGLNEVRAIAALMVLFHHVELYKNKNSIPSLFDTSWYYFIKNLGLHGVIVFFVLSGFLITYLLLNEKHSNGKVNLKFFYLRRVYRIFPLYYTILAIAFLLVPLLHIYVPIFQESNFFYQQIDILIKDRYIIVGLFLVFLPNLAAILSPHVIAARQTWTVGAEEQFYLIWPWVINKIKNKKIILSIFLLVALCPLVLNFVIKPLVSGNYWKTISMLFRIFPIYFMAFGAIAAYFLFYYKERIMPILKSYLVYIINTVLLIIFVCIEIHIRFELLCFAAIAAMQLLFIIQNNFKFNLRHPSLKYLGTISYGIYMYHSFIIYLSMSVLQSLGNFSPTTYNVLLYCLVPTITIAISHWSYFYFEKKFIIIKNKKYSYLPTVSGK